MRAAQLIEMDFVGLEFVGESPFRIATLRDSSRTVAESDCPPPKADSLMTKECK
jgi:hypothetical protein